MSYEKAIEQILNELKEHPHDARLLLKLAQLYQKSGESKSAASYYAKLAEQYDHDGFFLKAGAAAKQALKQNPGLIETRVWIAALYERLGLAEDALGKYRLALEHYRVAEDAENAARMLEAVARLEAAAKKTS